VVPELDVLVVDEAQDLSQLQWRIVNRMRESARDTFIAGDDDQAIFRWSGADVDYFLAASFADRQQVLDQSHRLPFAVHHLAEEISGRIEHRFEKVFRPTDKHGRVDYVASLDDAEALEEGEWLVLVRNNYQIQSVLDHLRYCGYAYEAERDKPANNDALRAAYTWESLRAGHDVAYEDAVAVPAYLTQPVPGAWDQTRPVSAAAFQAVTGVSLEAHWYDALGRMPLEEREYFRAARRRNENLRHPRIKVSTIHGAKGCECENVLLFTDVSNKTAQEMWRRPDDETRVFYVGATRALNRLCVVQPQTPAHFVL
jgi:DNA helicase-2/ATP-dependent DNA helicase PcrA